MAFSLGSLVIGLAADTARFQGDLGRAAHIAEARMRNIKDSATRALGALTVAATAAGAALTVAIRGAINRADEMRDMAQAAGVTVEALSRLAFAGKQSGVEIELIGKALAKLSKGGAVDANRALMDLADQFASMPDGAIKTAQAVEIFGERIGPQLIPLLNQGSIGLRRMADESDRLGNTISTTAANAADEFNDRMVELKATIQGLVNGLTAELLPLLNTLAAQLKETATRTEDLNRSTERMRTFLNTIITLGYGAYKTLELLGLAMAALARMTAHGGAVEVMRQLSFDVEEADRNGREFLQSLWHTRTEAEKALTGSGLPPGGRNRKRFVSMFGAEEFEPPKPTKPDQADLQEIYVWQREVFNLYNAQQEALRGLSYETTQDVERDLQRVMNGYAETSREMQSQWREMAEAARNAHSELTAIGVRAAQNMQDAFAQFLFVPFQDGLRGMLASFVDTLRQMVAQMAASQLFDFFGGRLVGSNNPILSGIGKFFTGKAVGGPVMGGRAYIVGERGPEAFVPHSSGTIVPNHRLGGNLTLAPVYNIDARGATQDLTRALPGILAENNRRLFESLRDARSRGIA